MPRFVRLTPHSSQWARLGQEEAVRIQEALGAEVVAVVHHVGSTAIPGIQAKPIIDLLGEVMSLSAIDAAAPRLKAIGYSSQGEFGIAGRRFFIREDASTGERRVHLHCFERGHREAAWMIAFRDYLRSHPETARAYEAEKRRAFELHREDAAAYTAAKQPWIESQRKRILAARYAEGS